MSRKDEFEEAKGLLGNNFTEGWKLILSLANSDYEEAMEFVALAYYRGDGVEMNEPLAMEWFRKIVKLNPSNGFIWNKIADCYLNGYGVSQNHKEALNYYQKAWENGVADAGSEIGWIYSFGEIDNHNDMTAAKWFQRAADKGSPQGMYFMGYFYDEGYGGLPVSAKMSEKYLRMAADKDNYSAIRYLLCKKCFGDTEEFYKLRKKMIDMAEDGDDRAQHSLGFAYLYGDDWDSAFGLDKDPEQSRKWFEKAAEQGNVDAMYQLGKNLLDYDSGYLVDIEKGEHYLLLAAEKGNKESYYELYRLYKWTKQDASKALFWAEKGANNGDEFLTHEVAQFYYTGEGTSVDYDKAAFYFQKCVKDDMDDVQSCLSCLPLAKCFLLSSNPTEEKYKQAYVYLKLAQEISAEKDYCSNQKAEIEYWTAYMLDNGIGMSSNFEEAFRHYSKSAELGFEKAQEEIKHFKKTIFGWKKI